jgi:hypothetical protein
VGDLSQSGSDTRCWKFSTDGYHVHCSTLCPSGGEELTLEARAVLWLARLGFWLCGEQHDIGGGSSSWLCGYKSEGRWAFLVSSWIWLWRLPGQYLKVSGGTGEGTIDNSVLWRDDDAFGCCLPLDDVVVGFFSVLGLRVKT